MRERRPLRSPAPVTLPLLVACCLATSSPAAPYLDQDPPGAEPLVFAPGLVSTDRHEVSCAFGPDGREFYFGRFTPGRGYALFFSRDTDEGWTTPAPAPFGSGESEIDIFVSADGGRCLYISKRPLRPGGPRSPVYRIWSVERIGEGWGRPRPLGPVANSRDRQLFPSLSREGTLYFGSDREGGFGGTDIYFALPEGSGFGAVQSAGPAVNTDRDETDALIAPDGSFLVFTSVDRKGGLGGGDLWVSFRGPDGGWLPAVNPGAPLNSPSSDFCPALSPDGRYFFFTSRRGGSDDIYWIDASFLHALREPPMEE